MIEAARQAEFEYYTKRQILAVRSTPDAVIRVMLEAAFRKFRTRSPRWSSRPLLSQPGSRGRGADGRYAWREGVVSSTAPFWVHSGGLLGVTRVHRRDCG